jgi:hemerythrin-like domain-containing protein
MSSAQLTTDHNTIKQWVKRRNGKPARVEGTDNGGPGLLRIDFPGYGDDKKLKPLRWDAFFKKFDSEGLALLYQETTRHGDISRFNKIVHAPQGVLGALHQEHEKVLNLLEKMAETTTAAVKTRPRMLEDLRQLLVPHMDGEEKVVYKALKKAGDRPTEVMEGYEEHRHARKALDRLEKADPETTDWTARLKVLKDLIEHHVEEEESEMFDLARNLMGEDGLEALSADYAAREEKTLAKL